MNATAFFLATQSPDGGQRLCVWHPASGAATRGLVLYIHPWAEEMNKARRMAALQARALAQAGFSVLQIDLLGCGDSSGDFGHATWYAWVRDVVQASRWLQDQHARQGQAPATPPLWLWGLRAGCLLAIDAARELHTPCHFLFWQAPASGKSLLQQFLRLKLAGEILNGQGKGAMENMQQQLAQGASVEVIGYRLSSDLALGLQQATLSPPPARTGAVQRLAWFELSLQEQAGMSPTTTQTLRDWQQAGFATSSHGVRGPAFWQSSELEEAPALLAATTAALLTPPA